MARTGLEHRINKISKVTGGGKVLGEGEMSDREAQLETALAALVSAIDQRWKGETPRRRDNALGPAIEEALSGARKLVGSKVRKTRTEQQDEEIARLRAELAARGVAE